MPIKYICDKCGKEFDPDRQLYVGCPDIGELIHGRGYYCVKCWKENHNKIEELLKEKLNEEEKECAEAYRRLCMIPYEFQEILRELNE